MLHELTIPDVYGVLDEPRLAVWTDRITSPNPGFQMHYQSAVRNVARDINYTLHTVINDAARMLRQLDEGTIVPRSGFPTLTTLALSVEKDLERLHATVETIKTTQEHDHA